MNSNGLAIIEVSGSETRSMFIDQDALECARLNAITKKRSQEAAKKARREAKLEAKRRAYKAETIRYIVSRCAITVAVTLAASAGFVHPLVSAAVSVFCLCTACVRLGAWLGRESDGK